MNFHLAFPARPAGRSGGNRVPCMWLLLPAVLLALTVGCAHTQQTLPDGSVVDSWQLTVTPEQAQGWLDFARDVRDALREADSPDEDVAEWERFMDKLEAIVAAGRPAPLPPLPGAEPPVILQRGDGG